MDRKVRRIKRQKEYKNAVYNNGNVAYEIQPVYYPENESFPIPAPPKLRVNKKKHVAKHAAVRVISEYKVHKVKIIMAVSVVFVCSVAVMGSSAILEQQRVGINQLKEQLSIVENENLTLQSEISEQADMKYIEEQAKTRLGMSAPKSYQTVYINVPKESYTMQYNIEEEKEEEDFFLSKLFNMFKKD